MARVLRSGVAAVANSMVSPGATRYSSADAGERTTVKRTAAVATRLIAFIVGGEVRLADRGNSLRAVVIGPPHNLQRSLLLLLNSALRAPAWSSGQRRWLALRRIPVPPHGAWQRRDCDPRARAMCATIGYRSRPRAAL